MYKRIALASLVLGLNVSQAHAQRFDDLMTNLTDSFSDITEEVMPDVTNVRLGFGPAYSPDYEGSDNYGVSIKPLISFHYRDFLLVDNNNIRINLYGTNGLFKRNTFKAGPLLKIDFGRDESDNPDLAGMGDISTSVELGAFASYIIGPTRTRVRLTQDVTSGHSGMKVIGDVRAIIRQTERLTVIGAFISTWADNSYMESYFSVTPMQSQLSGMSEFNARSGVKDLSFTLAGHYSLSRNWAALTNIGYSRLLGDAKNSPLVDIRGSANQFSASVFASYVF